MPNRWLIKFDLKMKLARHKVLLLIDNFAGHAVGYVPTNGHVEFFEPNLTSRMQPCNAGIIDASKATYQKLLCLHALACNAAGKENLWLLDIKDAMEMVSRAWDSILSTTI